MQSHKGAVLDIMEGEDAAAWAQSFNEMRPMTSFPIDTVWVLADPNEEVTQVRVAMFFKHQTCLNILLPLAQFEAIKEHAKSYRN